MNLFGALIDAAISAATKTGEGNNHSGDYSHLTIGIMDNAKKKG